MEISYRNLILHFVGFVKNPNVPEYGHVSKRQKLIIVGFYYLSIQFVVCAFILWYPVEIAGQLGLFNNLEEKEFSGGILISIISATILAPVLEELVFRLSLGYYRHKRYFKWLYYLSALLFGWIHIINYDFDRTHYFFIPFITMTQSFSGLMFGYIRIIYGFWYGVLLHSLFNILGVVWQHTVGFDL